MKTIYRWFTVPVFLGLFGVLVAEVPVPDPPNVQADSRQAKACVITCKGMIDEGLYKSIKRRTQQALEQQCTYLIYEISTYGGLVKSADDISKYLILDVGDQATTVAYIKTEAISAGAMISVSCNDIVMRKSTTIGDCAPITMGSKLEGVEREKSESFVRVTFDRAAKANGYPEALLRAMVSQQIEVYQLKNRTTGEFEYFETIDVPSDPNRFDIETKKLVVEKDKILTVDAEDAYQYGIARVVVDDLSGALRFFEERDDVRFAESTVFLETNWSEEMVRKVNHPAVVGILMMIAMLGLYIEFGTPGLGLPGLAAVICFTVIIGSKYLDGLANWVEVALFLIGLVLLGVELFVIPGFGVAGVAGIVCLLAGLFGMLLRNQPNEVPWPQTALDWQDVNNGLLGLAIGTLGSFALAWILGKYLPKMRLFNGLVLTPAGMDRSPVNNSPGEAPSHTESLVIGAKGRVLSTLRPVGKVRFGECVVDCVAMAEYIEAEQEVRVVEIHGNRIIVNLSRGPR